jgi:hypothetical protein
MAQQQMYLLTKPLFYGETTHMKGFTVDDFITCVHQQRDQNGWDNATMATHAWAFMRDKAHTWYVNTLEQIFWWNCAGLLATHMTWAGFQLAFKKMWFTINMAADLGVNWTTLKQLTSERTSKFCSRVVGHFCKYDQLTSGRMQSGWQRKPRWSRSSCPT